MAIEKSPLSECLELLPHMKRHSRPLKLLPRLPGQEVGISHQADNAALVSRLAFLLDQVREELGVCPVLARRLIRQRQMLLSKRRKS